MAKPKPAPPSPPSLGDPGETASLRVSPVEREALEQEQKIQDIIKNAGIDGITATVKRRVPGESDYGHLAEILAEGFSPEKVRTLYGGGDYKVSFRSAAGKFLGVSIFKVDYSNPSKFPGVGEKKEKSENDTAAIIAAITAAVKSTAPAAPAAPESPLVLEMMRATAETNRTLLLALTQRPTGPDPAISALSANVTALAAKVAELAAGGGGAGGVMGEIRKLQAVQSFVMEAGGGAGGAGEGEEKPAAVDWKLEAFRTLGPAFAPFLAQLLTNGAAAGAAQPVGEAQPAITAAAEPAATPAAPADQNSMPSPTSAPVSPMMTVFLKQFRTLAIAAAEKGRDPFAWVEMKLDDIPAAVHPRVFELANAEDWFAKIFAGDPRAAAQIEWLQKMRAAVLTQWLVTDLRANYAATPRPEAATYAAGLLDRASVSFHDTIFDLSEPGEWAQLLASPGVDAVWAEAVRAEFEKLLQGEDDTAAPAPEVAPESPGGPTPETASLDEKKSAKPSARAKK